MEKGDVSVSAPGGGLVDPDGGDSLEILCVTTRQMRSSPTSNSSATAFTGIARTSAITKASKSCVKPEPLRAQGTVTCRVLPHSRQATRGTAAWMMALCSKKGAREAATGLERDLEIDLLHGRVKRHTIDIPRRLQPKRHREKARLRLHSALHL
jgi:hypothetical protein